MDWFLTEIAYSLEAPLRCLGWVCFWLDWMTVLLALWVWVGCVMSWMTMYVDWVAMQGSVYPTAWQPKVSKTAIGASGLGKFSSKSYNWWFSARVEYLQCIRWVGVWGFSKVVPSSAMWVGSFMGIPKDVWIIPYFRIWGYVLHVEHISCVITNCGQHQWVLPSSLSKALRALLGENNTRKWLSLSLDLCFKILLFQVAFLTFLSVTIFSPYFLLVGLSLQYVTLFQSRELVKY